MRSFFFNGDNATFFGTFGTKKKSRRLFESAATAKVRSSMRVSVNKTAIDLHTKEDGEGVLDLLSEG